MIAVSDLTIAPGVDRLTLAWSVSGTGGNAIVVKWRPSGAAVSWRNASMAEVAPSATGYAIVGLAGGRTYDVEVVPVTYGTHRQAGAGTPQAAASIAVGVSERPSVSDGRLVGTPPVIRIA